MVGKESSDKSLRLNEASKIWKEDAVGRFHHLQATIVRSPYTILTSAMVIGP